MATQHANMTAIAHTLTIGALVLALVAPGEAREQIYEYETNVITEPVTLTGPGCAQVWIMLPEGVEGLMSFPFLKGCEPGGDGGLIDDIDVTFHPLRRHPDHYGVLVKICDRQAGRTQRYCPRLPYWPWPGHGAHQ